MLDKVQFYLKRKEAQQIIKETEEIASSIGESVVSVLEDVNRKIKNPAVAEAIRKLKRGLPRSRAYAGIFPKEVLTFLRVAEENNLSIPKVFKEYMKINDQIDTAFRKVRNTVIKGVGMVILTYVLGFILIKTLANMEIPAVKSTMEFYLQVFYYLSVVPFLYFLFFGVRQVAEKVNPVLMGIYKYFTLLKLLAVFKVSSEIGLQSKDVLQMYMELYPKLKAKIKRLRKDEWTIEGLAKILKDYLSPVEQVLLVKSVQSGRTQVYLEKVATQQIEKVEERTDFLISILGQINKFIEFGFVLYLASVFGTFMLKVTSLTSTMVQ